MKKVFDKRNLKLFERLLENQGISLKEEASYKYWKPTNEDPMGMPIRGGNVFKTKSLKDNREYWGEYDGGRGHLNIYSDEDILVWTDDPEAADDGNAAAMEENISFLLLGPAVEELRTTIKQDLQENQGASLKEETSVEKNINFINQFLGSADLDNETEARLARLARKVDIDKLSPEAKKNLIAALQGATQDGEMDDKEEKDITQAVAKEVPADVELAPDKYPPLKLAGEKGKIDTLGIVRWLKDYPGVEPKDLKSLAVRIDKYFAPSGKRFNNWKTNANWTAPAVKSATLKLLGMNEEANLEQPLGVLKTSDAKKMQAILGKNPALIKQMSLINNRAEYEEVIAAITNMVNNNITDPSDITTGLKNVLSKYVKAATQLKKNDDEKLDAKTAPLTRGNAAIGNTKMKGSRSLKDDMIKYNIPGDAIKQVLQALAGEFKINGIPFKEGMLRENKKRKVVIRYGKSKTKKEES